MKMKKILSAILALAMVAVLGITVSADEPDTTEADLSKVGISKILNVADDVDISAIKDFTFSFTGVNGDKTTAAEAGNKTVTITVDETSNGVAIGNKTFAEIFGDASSFSHAGEYVWKVKETTTGFSSSTANADKTLTVDNSEYTVSLYVANDPNGTGLVYKEVIVEKDGEKVDPTITEREYNVDPDTVKRITASGASFVNTYKEILKGDSTSPVLRVKKSITGQYSDKTMTFAVVVTFTIPDTATRDDVEVANGRVRVAWQGKTGTFTDNLSDNESIEFTKIPAGTTFTVSETQDDSYKSKITGFVSAEDVDYVGGNRLVAGKGPILEKLNEVFIENNSSTTVPTGLVLNTLPYVALVLIAAAGLVFFVFKKKANKD